MGASTSQPNQQHDEYSKIDTTKRHNGGNNENKGMEEECICNFCSFFCPASSRNTVKKRSPFDPIGTPLPDTPDVGNRRRMRELYDGLEREDSEGDLRTAKYSSGVFQGMNGWNGNNTNGARMNGEQELLKKYQLFEVMGVGSTSVCHRCIERSTAKSYACKIIDKRQVAQQFDGMIEQFQSEIQALQSLSHPNIISLYDVYTTTEKIYIVMELMAGGELFDYVVQKGTLTEAEASTIVRMVTSALVYMHGENIIHRDLKPENLMLTHRPNAAFGIEVKIIDFGLSKFMHEPMAKSFLGTRGYLAPEMLQRRQYSRAVDTWALGVIVFVLVCGCLPFDDDCSTVIPDSIIQSKFKLRFPRWSRDLSPSAKDLLSHLLHVSPHSRYTAEQAMRHPWVVGSTAPKDSLLQSPGRIVRPEMRSPHTTAAANRTQMKQVMATRAHANAIQVRQRHTLRKKSI